MRFWLVVLALLGFAVWKLGGVKEKFLGPGEKVESEDSSSSVTEISPSSSNSPSSNFPPLNPQEEPDDTALVLEMLRKKMDEDEAQYQRELSELQVELFAARQLQDEKAEQERVRVVTTYEERSRNLDTEKLDQFLAEGEEVFRDGKWITVKVHPENRDVVMNTLSTHDTRLESGTLRAWVCFEQERRASGFDFVARLFDAATSGLSVVATSPTVFRASIGDFSAALEAACSSGSLQLVDSPVVALIDGRQAEVSNVVQVPVPQQNATPQGVQTSFQYRDVGLKIQVTPRFFEDFIELEIVQESGVIGNERILGGFEIPEIATQGLKTTLQVERGEFATVGGISSFRSERKASWFSTSTEFQTGRVYLVFRVD